MRTQDALYASLRGELEAKKDRLRTQQEELERLRALEVVLAPPPAADTATPPSADETTPPAAESAEPALAPVAAATEPARSA